jgi:thiamine biosynthesis lipoprotein
MDNTPTASSIPNLKRAFALLFIIFFAAGLGYQFSMSLFRKNMEPETPQSPVVLKHIGNRWWESEQLIYHGIPTRVVFSMPPDTDIRPEAVNAAIWNEFDRIGKIFNPFDPNSEIFHLNSSPQSEPIVISGDMNSVIRISRHLWEDTEGHFDPTMWPIKQLWQNAEKNQQIPSASDITLALQQTGFNKILLYEKTENLIKFENHPVKFDFGGVVKGYAVDQVRQILVDSGITAGLVQLGGEISAFGKNDEKPWRIGVQHPNQMDKIWGVISSYGDLRVSTSGNYRQPISINGQSFYHIFSPKTGEPVSEKVLGVTTLSLDGKITNARLDGIATAITVMGAANGLELAEKLNVDVIILYENSDGTIGNLMTPRLSDYYTPTGK